MAVQDTWHCRTGGWAGLATWLFRIPGNNRAEGVGRVILMAVQMPGNNRAEGVGRVSHMAVQNTWQHRAEVV